MSYGNLCSGESLKIMSNVKHPKLQRNDKNNTNLTTDPYDYSLISVNKVFQGTWSLLPLFQSTLDLPLISEHFEG
jgi:hypothetical protein